MKTETSTWHPGWERTPRGSGLGASSAGMAWASGVAGFATPHGHGAVGVRSLGGAGGAWAWSSGCTVLRGCMGTEQWVCSHGAGGVWGCTVTGQWVRGHRAVGVRSRGSGCVVTGRGCRLGAVGAQARGGGRVGVAGGLLVPSRYQVGAEVSAEVSAARAQGRLSRWSRWCRAPGRELAGAGLRCGDAGCGRRDVGDEGWGPQRVGLPLDLRARCCSPHPWWGPWECLLSVLALVLARPSVPVFLFLGFFLLGAKTC